MLDAVCECYRHTGCLARSSHREGERLKRGTISLNSIFLDAFGRPPMNVDCPCDRDTSSNMVQATAHDEFD